jgi:putative SOS response-associated peptidase YedK
MCGRFALDDKVNSAISAFVAQGGRAEDWRPPGWRPNYNISPTDTVPIVREWTDSQTGEIVRQVDPAAWNFRPAWYKRPGVNINARIETVATTALYKAAFSARRALVPMNGYYEWSGPKEDRQPFYVHGPDDFLAAAGIYAGVKNDETGEWAHNFVIITREATDASGEIHDRMPAFLTPEVWDTWLQPGELADPSAMLDLLQEVSTDVAGTVTTYPVSKAINNPRTRDDWSDPGLIEPLPGA